MQAYIPWETPGRVRVQSMGYKPTYLVDIMGNSIPRGRVRVKSVGYKPTYFVDTMGIGELHPTGRGGGSGCKCGVQPTYFVDTMGIGELHPTGRGGGSGCKCGVQTYILCRHHGDWGTPSHGPWGRVRVQSVGYNLRTW